MLTGYNRFIMKSIIQMCMVTGVLVCAATILYAQDQPLTMKILETNSTENQFCFYVHANTIEQASSISVLADVNTADSNMEVAVVTECLNDDVCRTKICYDRPAFEPVETTIECRAISPVFSISDGCTVVVYPRGYRQQEPIEVNIIADCGFGTACDVANLNPNDITHLTLGVPREDGGFDYVVSAGIAADIQWYNEDRQLIHTGAWIDRPHEVAYVEFNHFQTYGPVLSGIGNTMGDAGLSFRYSTYPSTEQATQSLTLANYPNPFHGQTTIQFDLPEDAPVTMILYDMMGKTVSKILSHQEFYRGVHQVNFDAAGLDSGIYYYNIQAGNYTGTQRMNIVR